MSQIWRKRRWTGWGICALSALLVVAGCSRTDQPKTVPASGQVLYNGEPVAEARVAFWTEGAPKPAEALTDKEGKFRLSTFKSNDGAMPGEHKVTVTKTEGGAVLPELEGTTVTEDGPAGRMERMRGGQPLRHLIPERYSHVDTTDLRQSVTETGSNEFVLELVE